MAISCHVLDTTLGKPGTGIVATLQLTSGGNDAAPLYTGETDTDGRIKTWTSGQAGAVEVDAQEGTYQLRFKTAAYFNKVHGIEAFFPEVVVYFRCRHGEKYHVPLLLSPYAYSTYRGS
ncbi:hydroxyisourate hydrolase [Protomyces lactucae-debilis]|uniref:5-hydroxyisourate hydrolase n=1 Tax=Protomyces lactucae-debilis TaxID=2754530 RepID=A0A1Y2F7R0_PROLT|nr:hydroxyisourate hydrolase [Protomyces lactucae-debilis]ORY79932.1 hydroxyisourate hydrolase [Protomyces lactucae-debilis]